MPGDRVRQPGDGLPQKRIASDVDTWFAELDRFAHVPLLDDGRNQPPAPLDEETFDESVPRHQGSRGDAAVGQAP